MKIEDLRIGNLFLDNTGKITKVIAKTFTDIAIGVYWNAVYMPLTEEILINMGFSDKNYKEEFIGIDLVTQEFILTKPNVLNKDINRKYYRIYFSCYGNPHFLEFKYVHELQNFFYAFYGKDLKYTI